MRQLIIILITGILVTGCEKQKEQLEKFVFKNSQIAYRGVHKYTFDKNGRIKVDRTTSYYYMAGVPFDSTISETIFEYNDKGKLISALDLFDSSRHVRIYNDLDSLVGDYRINEFGDTTHLAVTVYDGNKVVRKMDRILSQKLSETFENIEKEDFRNYDTMLFISDLIYNKDLHVKTLSRDKTGMITEEIEQYYQNDKRVKTITYALLGDTKYIKKTTYFENIEHYEPDLVSIGTQGDTIAIIKTTIKSDGRIISNYNKEIGVDILYYNNSGQLLATEMVDVNTQEKITSKYTYDKKGNNIEEITYRERLNNAH